MIVGYSAKRQEARLPVFLDAARRSALRPLSGMMPVRSDNQVNWLIVTVSLTFLESINNDITMLSVHDEGINERYHEGIYERYEENIKQYIDSSNRNQSTFHLLRGWRIGSHKPGKRHAQLGCAIRGGSRRGCDAAD